MIFITLGTQDFQFNRVLKAIDSLIENNFIKEEVFAQVGYSDYKPKNYLYKEFLTFDEFESNLDTCDVIITHGGTGSIVNSIKKGKKVIAIPRKKKYNEHVDDHQVEIVSMFSEKGLIYGIDEVNELYEALKNIKDYRANKFISGNKNIIGILNSFVKEAQSGLI